MSARIERAVFYRYRGKGGKKGRRELPRPAWAAIRRTVEDGGKELATMTPEESLWQAGAGSKGISGSTFYGRFRRYLVGAGLQPTGLHITIDGRGPVRLEPGPAVRLRPTGT